MICHAYMIDFFFKKYMLHIWLKPRIDIGFHKKVLSPKGKIFWIEKYK